MNYRDDQTRRFLRAILEAMGASALTSAVALGCGGNVVVDNDGTNTGGGGAGGGSTTTTITTTTTVTTTPMTCSYDPPTWGEPKQACLPLQGDVCPFENSPSTLDALAKVLGVCSQTMLDCCSQPTADAILCGSLPTNDQCCYVVVVSDGPCAGRPFMVAGEARRAPVVRSAWSTIEARSQGVIDDVTRRAIADGWARDAQLEHASVASFARLALELLAIGAPADLVREAQEAMGDEIRHAEISFAIASAHRGVKVGPGPLPIEGAMGRTTIADLAAATVREGCVGETIAAILAAEMRDAASDPAARTALATIAQDEEKHAASAWKLVAWAAREGGAEAAGAIARAFDEAFAAPISAGRADIGVDEAVMRAHGRLPAAEVAGIAGRAIAEIIKPARAALEVC